MRNHDIATRNVYRHGGDSVRRQFSSLKSAKEYYAGYLKFTRSVAPPNKYPRYLDLGCGNGYSSLLLTKKGYSTLGIDMSRETLQVSEETNLKFITASAEYLPLSQGSVDVVGSYQMLEHVPVPKLALDEMVRVCRSGGLIIVAGPNLLSPLNCVRRMFSKSLEQEDHTPDIPHGNTRWEALGFALTNSIRIVHRSIMKKYDFLYRTPDFRPPFRGDSDSCFYLNPLDVIYYLQEQGCSLVRNGQIGRPGYTATLAGGTWIAMRKD